MGLILNTGGRILGLIYNDKNEFKQTNNAKFVGDYKKQCEEGNEILAWPNRVIIMDGDMKVRSMEFSFLESKSSQNINSLNKIFMFLTFISWLFIFTSFRIN